MPREGINLFETDIASLTDPEQISMALSQLKSDFDAHTHDGVNSRSFQTLIAETLVGRSAIIGGYKLFDAIVGATSADYKTVAAALKAGKTRIFVRNGTYTNEPSWNLNSANIIITGENFGGVDIQFKEDSTAGYHVQIAQQNIKLQNLKLTANETSNHHLIKINYNANVYFVVDDCILKNRRYNYVYGADVAAKHSLFRNCRFDVGSVGDASTPNIHIFDSVKNVYVVNCSVFSNINYTGTGWLLAYSCSYLFFNGSKIIEDGTNDINTSNNSGYVFFVNCQIEGSNIISDAHFTGNFFRMNQGSTPTGYFISLTPSTTTFNSNRVYTSTDQDLLVADSANITISSNYFEGGKNIVLNNASTGIKGLIFSGNQWVSGYTSAAIALTIGANISVSNVIGNIIRNNSNSFTPTLTDSGSLNNVQYNQLIKG